jgi:hypothetical protein
MRTARALGWTRCHSPCRPRSRGRKARARARPPPNRAAVPGARRIMSLAPRGGSGHRHGRLAGISVAPTGAPARVGSVPVAPAPGTSSAVGTASPSTRRSSRCARLDRVQGSARTGPRPCVPPRLRPCPRLIPVMAHYRNLRLSSGPRTRQGRYRNRLRFPRPPCARSVRAPGGLGNHGRSPREGSARSAAAHPIRPRGGSPERVTIRRRSPSAVCHEVCRQVCHGPGRGVPIP